jgi:glycosyltransferase involved in cell wall biosynthesis
VLDTAIARETLGPAASYVSPAAEIADVASAIQQLLVNDAARHELLQHADGVLARFDWNVTASATLQVLEEAARGR